MRLDQRAVRSNRRQFIRRLGAISASIAVGARWLSPPRVAAIEPLSRTAPKMMFSLAAYSYRRLLKAGELTLFDFVDDCARFGLEGTELTSYYFPDPVANEYLLNLKRHCFRQCLDVSGTAVGNDFGYSAGSQRDEEIASVKLWIDRAVVIGAPVIRVFAGHAHDTTPPEQVHSNIVDGISECCHYAGQRGVHLALENHGGPTATVDGLLSIVRDVDSPWFGVNLDTGNFRSADVYGDLRRAAPYALNVQVKVMLNGANGQREAADFGKLAEILREANYCGYVVLEYEDDGDPRSECERQLDTLRTAFSA